MADDSALTRAQGKVIPYAAQPQTAPIDIQHMTDLVQMSANAVRALANIYTALQGINIRVAGQFLQLPLYTVATLPAVVTANAGSLAFVSNGRNTGEGAAAGTGCTVQVQLKAGVATWCAIWSGVAVTA